MKKTLYIKTCRDCHKIFRTDQPNATICESCKKFRKPKLKPKKKKKAVLSISAISHIEHVYNTVHKTVKHYGDIVRLIENTEADRCVCCGEIVPEGRMVCPTCESQVNK